jgi:hypothetical protein
MSTAFDSEADGGHCFFALMYSKCIVLLCVLCVPNTGKKLRRVNCKDRAE